MKQLTITLLSLFAISLGAMATDKTITIQIKNPTSDNRESVPVVLPLDSDYRTALVTVDGVEVPCQLDDLDDDGVNDELAFTVSLTKKQKLTATVVLSTEGQPRKYDAKTFAFLSIRDRDKSAKQPKHLPIKSLTVPATSNPYQYAFPHGLLLESELIGYRVYADHRQSVDLYGHQQKQLELPTTMFYPTKEQKAAGYGDDVLYTGSTYGCGTLQGWNGKQNVMYDDVRTRTYTLVTDGPVRAIVRTVNKAWKMLPDSKPVDVTTDYIIYAGHRDVQVNVQFSRTVADLQLSTGVVDLMSQDCEKMTDKAGLLAIWGRALAGNNPKVYDEHTVGIAVCVPRQNYKGESYFTDTPRELLGTFKEDGKPVTPNQAYAMIVGTETDHLNYSFVATADTETFGFGSKEAWYQWLKQWKKELTTPVIITNL